MFSILALAALLPMIQAVPAPAVAPVAELEDRASTSCTFTTAAQVAKSKTSCSTITLSNIAVPAGTTLDLTGLNSGTKVRAHQSHDSLSPPPKKKIHGCIGTSVPT